MNKKIFAAAFLLNTLVCGLISTNASANSTNGIDTWLGQMAPETSKTITIEMPPGKASFNVLFESDSKGSCTFLDSTRFLKEQKNVGTCSILTNSEDVYTLQIKLSNHSNKLVNYRVIEQDLK